MKILRQSTEVIVRIGPFPDVGDGFTPQIDITLGAADEAELLKPGSVEVDISGRTWAAVTNCRGWFDLTLTTDDTDTVGILTVVVQDDSECLPVSRDFQVVEEAVYDEIFKAAATGGQGVIETNKLDHLVAVAESSDVVNSSIIAKMVSSAATPAFSSFANTTDSLQAIRDVAPHGSTMVGTNGAALASVVGALADAAAAGQVSEGDTLMKYIKQLINILIGTPGIAAFPSEAAPANAVSLAEVIRAIHADVTGLNGAAMKGTDSAALASVCSSIRLARLDADVSSRSSHDADAVKTAMEDAEAKLGALFALIASSKIAAQVKGQDDIDFSATQKASLNAATPVSASNSIYGNGS